MKKYNQLYINGQWHTSTATNLLEVINPANGQIYTSVVSATKQDAENAIDAASNAFLSWSQQSAAFRAQAINEIADGMQQRADELTQAIVQSMGCPVSIASDLQVQGAIDAFRQFSLLTGEMDKQEKTRKSYCYQ